MTLTLLTPTHWQRVQALNNTRADQRDATFVHSKIRREFCQCIVHLSLAFGSRRRGDKVDELAEALFNFMERKGIRIQNHFYQIVGAIRLDIIRRKVDPQDANRGFLVKMYGRQKHPRTLTAGIVESLRQVMDEEVRLDQEGRARYRARTDELVIRLTRTALYYYTHIAPNQLVYKNSPRRKVLIMPEDARIDYMGCHLSSLPVAMSGVYEIVKKSK